MHRRVRMTLTILCLYTAVQAGAAWAGKDDAESGGAKVVGEICSGCHATGLMGAPKIGDAVDWQARYKNAGSVNALAEVAKHGKGNMPPRGGESSLTDAEVQSAIQYMLGHSGVSY